MSRFYLYLKGNRTGVHHCTGDPLVAASLKKGLLMKTIMAGAKAQIATIVARWPQHCLPARTKHHDSDSAQNCLFTL